MRLLINILSLFFSLVAFPRLILAQELKILSSGTNTSLRGLSVVTERVVWCSGSNGKVAKTTDGGKSFQWFTVQGHEQRDFRDIHAFDSISAIIIAIDTPAIILKTSDGGKSWYKVFEDKRPGMFLDAIHFEGNYGMVIGDPIDGKPFLAQSSDKGESWRIKELMLECQQTINGEAFFAASGSNIQMLKTISGYSPIYVSGGLQSRMFYQDQCIQLPLQSGKSYTGANGLIYSDRLKKGVVIGGDFSNAKRSDSAMVFFEVGRRITVGQPIAIPSGYKSGISFLRNGDLLVCGTTGIAKWKRGDKSWTQISTQSAHAIQSDKKNRNTYLCGSKGLIARIID
jgi:photosystem II stability/assembly factor-like uncharacterized protein